MLTERTYVTVTTLMVAILLLFQFSGASKEAFSNYTVNAFAAEENVPDESSFFAVGSSAEGDWCLFYGEDESLLNSLTSFCRYRRRNLVRAEDISDLGEFGDSAPAMILVDGQSVTEEEAGEVLDALEADSEDGVMVVFGTLPSDEILREHEDFMEYLGISELRGEVSLTGYSLKDGFLLGGGRDYVFEADDSGNDPTADLPLAIPWYLTGTGTVSCMSGIPDAETYGEVLEVYRPAVVWMRSFGSSYVCCVNGDFMKNETAIGFLATFESLSGSLSVYPVINSQSLVLANFPVTSSENEDEMQELYSRSSAGVVRDLVWPTVESVVNSNNAVPTCMIAPYLQNTWAADPALIDSSMSRIRENLGEAGFSAEDGGAVSPDSAEGTSVKDGENVLSQAASAAVNKLTILKETMPDYAFQTAWTDSLPAEELLKATGTVEQMTAVVVDTDPAEELMYSLDGTMVLRSTSGSGRLTWSGDLKNRSLHTGLGYSVVTEDFSRALFPESEEDHWNVISREFATKVADAWSPYKAFEKTALSGAGVRIARYLTEEWSSNRDGDEITIACDADEENESYFVVRLYGEKISAMSGGSFQKIEGTDYLVTVTEKNAVIALEKSGGL